jgi:hypothetical protein
VGDGAVTQYAGVAGDRAVLERDPERPLTQLEVQHVGPLGPLVEVAVVRGDRPHAVEVVGGRAFDPQHGRGYSLAR